MSQDKQRIVILGGGMAALAAAWELTNQPDWQSRYDITLHQVGWRLGGKCASGRGPNGRIEEHGIHVLMGFYDTVFGILQSCYGEMARPPGAPLATWQQAVEGQGKVVLMESIGENWLPWEFRFRPNAKVPGPGHARRHPHAVLRSLMRRMLATHFHSPLFRSPHLTLHRTATQEAGHHRSLKESSECLRDEGSPLAEDEKQDLLQKLDEYLLHIHALPIVQHALSHGAPGKAAPGASTPHGLLGLLEAAEREAEHLVREVEAHLLDPILCDIRRAVISLELGYAMARGILLDGVLKSGDWDFEAINHLDLRDWIGRNLEGLPGDHTHTTDSAAVRGIYDLVFAYADGVAGRFALEAGTALSFMLRIVFEYKGAIYWHMMAGMGDVVMAPLHQVLKARGVGFEFFHAVKRLHLAPDGASVESIEIGQQVRTRGEYDPLIEVQGLPCYPSEPVYERLELAPGEEQELRGMQKKFNGLESPWTPWPDREVLRLEAGRDFDRVILGISIGALKRLCPELEELPRWKNLFDNIQTTATQSAQMWMKPSLTECGWERGPCVMDAYAQPFNSWMDESHLIGRENWPQNSVPGSIAYFTGPLPNQSQPPPYEEHGYAEEQHEVARQNFQHWLGLNTRALFPNACAPEGHGLDFDVLIDPQGGHGEARLEAQYWRANVNPSDHYVLSVPGSSRHRLAPGDSGLDNVILTGDWTRNGMNAGSVEAAAVSGVLAAQALLKTI